MAEASVLHAVITANESAVRTRVRLLEEARGNLFLSNGPFVKLVPSACDKSVKN